MTQETRDFAAELREMRHANGLREGPSRRPAYRIELTEADARAVAFVGGRYEWSGALGSLIRENDDGTPEPVELTEPEAWTLREAFEADAEGGHSMFPMLDSRSDLAAKLWRFVDSVI